MKLAIIAIVALLVLGGGAAGAYFYFIHPAQAALVDGEKKAGEQEEAAASGEEGEKAVYVQMDPLVLPIVDENGASQTISLVIVIEVKDDAAAEKVKNLKPRLTDAYIQDMYGVLNKQMATEGGMVQVGPIKKRLNDLSVKVVGENVVKDVLLQVVEQRPL